MHEEESVQGGPKRSPWIAFSIIATAAIAMVVAFFIADNQSIQEQDQERRQERLARLQRGTSCSALFRAESALNSDNSEALARSLKEARRRAEHALDTSGILFGAPERHAMFLAEDLRRSSNPRIESRLRDRLALAVDACDRIVAS